MSLGNYLATYSLRAFGHRSGYLLWRYIGVHGKQPANFMYADKYDQVTWTVLTFCLCRCTSARQVYALRFFVGKLHSLLVPFLLR